MFDFNQYKVRFRNINYDLNNVFSVGYDKSDLVLNWNIIKNISALSIAWSKNKRYCKIIHNRYNDYYVPRAEYKANHHSLYDTYLYHNRRMVV